jgi:hypothetical protein
MMTQIYFVLGLFVFGFVMLLGGGFADRLIDKHSAKALSNDGSKGIMWATITIVEIIAAIGLNGLGLATLCGTVILASVLGGLQLMNPSNTLVAVSGVLYLLTYGFRKWCLTKYSSLHMPYTSKETNWLREPLFNSFHVITASCYVTSVCGFIYGVYLLE